MFGACDRQDQRSGAPAAIVAFAEAAARIQRLRRAGLGRSAEIPSLDDIHAKGVAARRCNDCRRSVRIDLHEPVRSYAARVLMRTQARTSCASTRVLTVRARVVCLLWSPGSVSRAAEGLAAFGHD